MTELELILMVAMMVVALTALIISMVKKHTGWTVVWLAINYALVIYTDTVYMNTTGVDKPLTVLVGLYLVYLVWRSSKRKGEKAC